MKYIFTAKLWEWSGQGAWHFLTVPTQYYNDIKMFASPLKKGFGSIRVEVRIGDTAWKTSVFPDSKMKTYLLPVKKSVRLAEHLEVDHEVEVILKLIEI